MKKSTKLITLVLLVAILSVCLTACAPKTLEEITTNLEKNDFTVETKKATSAGGLQFITTATNKVDKKIAVTILTFDNSDNADKYYPVVEAEKERFDKDLNDKIDKEKDEKKKEALKKEKDTFVIKKAGQFIFKGYKVAIDSAF